VVLFPRLTSSSGAPMSRPISALRPFGDRTTPPASGGGDLLLNGSLSSADGAQRKRALVGAVQPDPTIEGAELVSKHVVLLEEPRIPINLSRRSAQGDP
jgi:hypothetical protein